MANQEHLEILKRGAIEWNKWREDNPIVWPDLQEARLPFAKLDGANLENANLLKADLDNASLAQVKLRNCNLRSASLIKANLREADLQEANLYGARLQEANLEWANLRDANLLKVSFDRTKLAFATFAYTSIDRGLIEGGLGLGNVFHPEHSIVDSRIFAAAAQLLHKKPSLARDIQWFFRAVGIPSKVLAAYMEIEQQQEWYSIFVSYSHDDREFLQELCARFDARHVPYWRDDRRLSVGAVLFDEVASAIIHHDRTLLCCSHTALASPWVEKEINVALKKEHLYDRSVLVPLDLDGCLLGSHGSRAKERLGPERFIGDFREWRDPAKFKYAFERVLQTLRTGLASSSSDLVSGP